ncbi:MAG: hypothetical protein JW929_13005 [Anaerolineales bacterium]|nr:hypothetical protein [Anaerolineales bacterium]
MSSPTRSSIRTGLALILLGVVFLVFQIVPGLSGIFRGENAPALVLFAVALILALIGIATGASGMIIPVCIIAGIGGIFYWQTALGAGFFTWNYAWTLIPGFVGVGIFLNELLQGRPLKGLNDALGPIIFSLAAFLIFGSLFGGIETVGITVPVLLIALGLVVMLKPLFSRIGSSGGSSGPQAGGPS